MLSRSFLWAVILVAGASLASARAPGMYRDAVAAFKQTDYLRAAELAEKAVAAAPDHIPSRLILAQSYHAIFEDVGLYYSEAVDAYQTLVRRLSGTVDTWSPIQVSRVLLGHLYLRGGDYAAALHHLTEFLSIQPEHRDADSVWNSVGVTYYYQNEYAQAVAAFEKALEINPEFQPARFNLRSVFTRLGMFDQAMASLRMGHKELALADFDNLLVMAPRYMPAILQKGLILYDLGRDAEARRVAGRAIALQPDDQTAFELRMLLGDIAARNDEPVEAIEHYRRCLRIQPGFMQVVEKINLLEARAAREQSEGTEDAAKAEPADRPSVSTDVNRFPM